MIRRVCEVSAALTKSICTPLLFGRERGEIAEDDLQWISGQVERRMWWARV